MGRKKIQTPEDIARMAQERLDMDKKELQKYVSLGFIPSNPTRSFEIGQEVEMGAHEHVVVIEKDETGLLYLLHCKYEIKSTDKFSSRDKNVDTKMWRAWMDIFPNRTKGDWENIPKFTEREEMRLQFYQTSINSFDSHVYHFGLDLNPDYQRGHVWNQEDKEKLIDSIFKCIDIGKFVFIRRDYSREKNETPHLYEILDGKQRLTAIMEFREDRFKYKGFFYSELHPHDQSHIDSYGISVADVTSPTKEQIYRYFLRLNTGGKPMDYAQLMKVENLLKNEIQKKG